LIETVLVVLLSDHSGRPLLFLNLFFQGVRIASFLAAQRFKQKGAFSCRRGWISELLRRSPDFAKVLQHYGVELKIKGAQHKGFCPLPTHVGQRRSPSFSAILNRNIWRCFRCEAEGNVLDFAVRMEASQRLPTRAEIAL